MARAKSAVLSPADKKAVVADLKSKIAAKKADLKLTTAATKDLNKQLLAIVKVAAGHDKELAKLVASLTAITAPAANAALV